MKFSGVFIHQATFPVTKNVLEKLSDLEYYRTRQLFQTVLDTEFWKRCLEKLKHWKNSDKVSSFPTFPLFQRYTPEGTSP